MMMEKIECVSDVLYEQVERIEAALLAGFSGNGLAKQLLKRRGKQDNGTFSACLSFYPSETIQEKSIDLTISIYCRGDDTVYASEIAWSDGRAIEEAVVCQMCPDCLDTLCEKVDRVFSQTQKPLVERMANLLDHHYRG